MYLCLWSWYERGRRRSPQISVNVADTHTDLLTPPDILGLIHCNKIEKTALLLGFPSSRFMLDERKNVLNYYVSHYFYDFVPNFWAHKFQPRTCSKHVLTSLLNLEIRKARFQIFEGLFSSLFPRRASPCVAHVINTQLLL